MTETRHASSKPPSFGGGFNQITGRPTRGEEEVMLKGKIKWCKHLVPDTTFEAVGKWSVVMYLEGAELDKARELQGQGIKNTIKKDEDGWYITLSRKCSYEVRGKHIGRTPPEVFRLVNGAKEPLVRPIGNGSDGVAKCVLWSSKNFPGKNLRWEALRVDNLVEYEKMEDYPELKSLAEEAPEQIW